MIESSPTPSLLSLVCSNTFKRGKEVAQKDSRRVHYLLEAILKSLSPCLTLVNVRQKENESLCSYLKRFNKEASKVYNVPEGGILMALAGGVWPNIPIWKNLQKVHCTDVEDFYQRAKKNMRMENAQIIMDPSIIEETTTKKVNKQKRSDDQQATPSSPKKNKKKTRSNEKRYPQFLRFTYYTDLNDSREHILLATEDKAPYQWPPPIFRLKGGRKDQSKYCRFHRDYGHDTND
ncbi:hypothetical protein TorRG33x02_108260 [Trema orientale]|uniref:Uncharacterized protein n=1 Tax=Trema orientale TaxID=63057 RepID=A0A2P5F649_TREOI|nr:hypothetical protein TorRG33x02_108260 [Trema orientale]